MPQNENINYCCLGKCCFWNASWFLPDSNNKKYCLGACISQIYLLQSARHFTGSALRSGWAAHLDVSHRYVSYYPWRMDCKRQDKDITQAFKQFLSRQAGNGGCSHRQKLPPAHPWPLLLHCPWPLPSAAWPLPAGGADALAEGHRLVPQNITKLSEHTS